MEHKFIFSLLFICVICYSSIAQTTLTGVVVDSDNQAVLPFVNIGIKLKNIGTSSLLDGTFSIKIPIQNENDSITFSMVGYSELNLPIKVIVAKNQKIFQLKIKTIPLKSVVVTASKLVEQKFGIKKTGGIVHITDGSTNQNDIFEIAQLIELDTTLSKITSVNLHLTESRTDSGTFRINFYEYDGNRPTERIIEKSIVQTKQIQEGWLKFDLTKYDVYLKGNFVVAIEFIPTEKKSNQIYYEVKIGGPSKSFVRASSQGEWNVPPAHYRLFITALVADKKTKQDDSEKETAATTTLFSEFVNDSFSIFIRLPNDYSTKKNKIFSVIYLLDANVYFDIVADAMKENKSNAILVGIGYKDFISMDSLRNRDYTFPKAAQQDSFPVSGGADNYLSFLRSELLPYIDKTYRTDTISRVLMGHSLGGYFPLYALKQALLNKNNSFKNYVAASPSLEYGNNYLIKEFQNISTNDNTNQQTLFITFGAREDSEEGGTGTEGIDNFNLFVTLLTDVRFKNIKVKSEVYPKFGHMETAVPTFTKSLQEIK